MPIQYVNTGSSPNKGDGDSLRTAFTKINYNFGQLITLLGSTVTDVTTIATDETIRLLSHNQHSGVTVQYNSGLDKITVTALPPFDQDLNTTNSPTFNNLSISNTATFGGDIDVAGTIKVGIVQGYDDFTIIKEDPDGLHLRLRNTVDYGASSIELVNSYFGGLVVLHQNPIQSGDYLPDNNYIYGMLPGNTLNIGRYSDINFYANAAAYGNAGAMLTATASISVISTTGNVVINKTLTVAETTATATINLGTDRFNGKIEREHVAQVGYIFTFPTNYSGATSALTGGDFLYLPVNSESTLIQPGWTLTFANGHQELVESTEYIDFGGGIEVQAVRWLTGLDLPGSAVWPVDATSADYQEVIRTITLTPDLQVPAVNWSFARKGALIFPDGSEQRTAFIGGSETTSTFYSVLVTSTETTTLPTTGALVVAGGAGIGENLHVGGVGYFGLEPPILLENPLAVFTGNANGYVQIQIQNISNGTSASTDFIATSDIGTDTDNYIDVGINGSNFDSGEWTISGPNDGYLYVNGGSVTVGTDTPGETVTVHIGGTLDSSKVAVFRDPGTTGDTPVDGAFVVYGDSGFDGKIHVRDVVHIGTNTNLALENPLIKAGANIDGYVQVHIQNQSGGYSASSDFIATTNDGSDSEHYIDLGINNSGFSSVDWTMSGAHDGYLYVNDGNLTVGTDTAGKQLKINIGGVLAENIVAVFDAVGTASTSTTTGALTVAGGIGVAGDIVSHNLIPAADLTYDLGSPSKQWRHIYVSTGSIYLGDVKLTNQDGKLDVTNVSYTINPETGELENEETVNNYALTNALTVSDSAPIGTTGSMWFNNIEGRLYVNYNDTWVDASPTQIPSPETYLDGLAIDGTVIGTANVDGDAIVIDGGDNTKLTVSNNSVTIQVPGSLTRSYWAAEFGGITTAVTTSSAAIGTGAFYDSQGNVYVLGGVQFDSTSTFGLDSLLLKYDINGNLLWSRTWHDDSGANCGAINQAFAIDSNDKIYWLTTAVEEGFGCWTGYMDTEGNLGLGGVAQGSLGFLDGNFAGADIACDNSGNYYLAGVFFDYVNNTETPVVIKVDGDNGVPIWTGSIVPEDFESLPSNGTYRAVTVNPATGDVWAIGDYYDGGLRAMLSKWDINGSHQWTKELVTTTGDLAAAVIYNGGYVYTIVNDDPDAKAVVSKFDTDGVLIWASFLAVGALDPIPNNFGDYNTGAYDLSFDAAGNVYVTGTISGPPVGNPQLWITKLDPANGEMLYSRMLATSGGSLILDQGAFGGGGLGGHRVGDIYQDTIVVTAITESDIDDSTGTNAQRVIVAQLPIDGSVTGTFDNIDIIDITSDIDGICSTGTYTVTTLVWSTGTSTAIYSTSSISVSYVTDVIGLTGETIALGSGTAGGSTTTNTWTFVNNNIILPMGGDILDSNGVSVLGATTSTTANGWQLTSSTAVVSLSSTGTLTLPGGSTIGETTTTTIISPPGASAGQSFVIRPTGAINTESSHIHLVSGNPTTVDLYLGDDDQYVKIEKNAGNVVVGTNSTATTSTWTFGTDGVLTLSTASTILGNSEDPNVYIETATTSTTNTWTFAADGGLTFPDNTVQTTAYKTGQTTVELSTLTEVMSAGYEITSLEGINVIYFTTASGYTDVATHLGAIPLPEYPGQRVTIINDANSTVTVAWTVLAQSVSITLDNYDSSDLIAITHPKYGGLAWWETNRYNW